MKEFISADLKSAMKSGDKVRLMTVRSISMAVINYEKGNPGKELPISGILRSLAKQREMSIDAFTLAGETELANNEKAELAVINEYIEKFLPKQMSEDEIRTALEEIVVFIGGKSEAIIGKAMGEFSKRYKGMADMKLVGNILKEVIA